MARPSSERHEELEELEEELEDEEEERRSGESVVPESDSTVDFDVILTEGASALSTQLSSKLFTTKKTCQGQFCKPSWQSRWSASSFKPYSASSSSTREWSPAE